MRSMLAWQLATHGQDIDLKRRVGTGATFEQVTVRAVVSGFKPNELAHGITQQDSHVIYSQEEILAAGWPQSAGGLAYARNGDFMVIDGAQRAVTGGTPVVRGGEVVRLEATVRG
jgi:hypothetical protein